MPTQTLRVRASLLAFVLAAGCDLFDRPNPAPPPQGSPIARTEGTEIAGATGWRWVPFGDAFCTDAVADGSGRYVFGTSTTGLGISWGPTTSTDLVIFLQGGGACFDFLTCGGAAPLLDKTAHAGPFGATEFAENIYARYPNSWIRRERLPPSIADATIVFVPYCTGDVHGGDRVTTYVSVIPGLPSVTWHHVGHANIKAFLKRLAPTFPRPRNLVIAGSSGGGFGSLANYTTFRESWPDAKAYMLDDSGPPLIGNAIPFITRALWYSNWNLGASLDSFCPQCPGDLSEGLKEIMKRYPQDRIALVSHLQDAVIRGFFGTISVDPPAVAPMPATEFEAELRLLGTTVIDPTGPTTTNARYFFTAGDGHPMLEDPTVITSPAPGLEPWIELMLSDSDAWVSASD
jgi:Pectinacetylesterase